MIERPDHVRVTNDNKFKIVGRFNGEDYEFLPGKPLDIPLTVAVHVFDFGRPDKARALNRLGWMQSSDQLEQAMEKLNRVRFTQSPALVEQEETEPAEPSASELLPAVEGSTAPPVSPDASGGGSGGKPPSLPKPRGTILK